MTGEIKAKPIYQVTVEEMIGPEKTGYEFLFDHRSEAIEFARSVIELKLALDVLMASKPRPLLWDSAEALKYLQAVRKPYEEKGGGE